MGDGAGAVVLTEGDNIKGIKLNAEPDVDKIWMTRPLIDNPYAIWKEGLVPMQMKGREVFRFAVNAYKNGLYYIDSTGVTSYDCQSLSESDGAYPSDPVRLQKTQSHLQLLYRTTGLLR